MVEVTEVPTSYEGLSKSALRMIQSSVSQIQAMVLRLYDVDVKAGAGVLSKNKKCIWTKDGRRITMTLDGGAFFGSISKEPDPLYKKENRPK